MSKTQQFAVGDRVKISAPHSSKYDGAIGVVRRYEPALAENDGYPYVVAVGDIIAGFKAKSLTLVTDTEQEENEAVL